MQGIVEHHLNEALALVAVVWSVAGSSVGRSSDLI
jgi:hypothetical protein